MKVAQELDLQALAPRTSSVSAFQVLTINGLNYANLDASLRSFLRHITAAPNQNWQDGDKKRKYATYVFPEDVVHPSIPESRHINNNSSLKKLKDDEEEAIIKSNVLRRSIESLYASISNAEKELEAGRNWREEMISDM